MRKEVVLFSVVYHQAVLLSLKVLKNFLKGPWHGYLFTHSEASGGREKSSSEGISGFVVVFSGRRICWRYTLCLPLIFSGLFGLWPWQPPSFGKHGVVAVTSWPCRGGCVMLYWIFNKTLSGDLKLLNNRSCALIQTTDKLQLKSTYIATFWGKEDAQKD